MALAPRYARYRITRICASHMHFYFHVWSL